jgi:hypothetical protein
MLDRFLRSQERQCENTWCHYEVYNREIATSLCSSQR